MKTLTRDDIEQLIVSTVEEKGYLIFDLYVPITPKGAVRVFIEKKVKEPINHEDCASVSKALHGIEDLDWMFEKYSLEVSSPGLNRVLKTPKQFNGAVGEKIKFTVSSESGEKTDTYFGILKMVNESEISVLLQDTEVEKIFNLNDVRKANVETDILKHS